MREEWPPDLEDSIIKMLTTPPVNQFLKVLTYQESPQAGQAIPIVYVTNSRRFEDILAPAA
jgi:hypothetical protein